MRPPSSAPVIPHTTVVEVTASRGPGCTGFVSSPTTRTWHARHVVVATGPMAGPTCPPACPVSPDRVEVLPANSYRNPAALPPGGVLVVGASASGVQIADELIRAGREVVIAIGRHTRMPRRYRGMDSFWWLEATGRLARTIDEVPDLGAARRETSLQLVGVSDPCVRGRDLDLRVLQARGVRLLGRLEACRRAQSRRSQRPRRTGHRRRPEDAPLPGRRRPLRRRAGLTREVLPGNPARSGQVVPTR